MNSAVALAVSQAADEKKRSMLLLREQMRSAGRLVIPISFAGLFLPVFTTHSICSSEAPNFLKRERVDDGKRSKEV